MFGKASECSTNMRCHYRRDGKSKVSFDNLGKVKSVCICFWEKNEDMRPYKCRLCNKYHKAAKRSKRQQSLEPKKEEKSSRFSVA